MRHRDRGSVLDVHHTILPPSSRLRPDPALFWRSAVPLADGSMAFCPTHMALHVAVHLFQDGEIAGGLGDLVDFSELCRHFGGAGLLAGNGTGSCGARAGETPFYALRYASMLLGATVPATVTAEAERNAKPCVPVRAAMDPLVCRALVPDLPEDRSPWWQVARLCLYIRSHWLRMPPLPLALHLLRKAWARRFSAAPPQHKRQRIAPCTVSVRVMTDSSAFGRLVAEIGACTSAPRICRSALARSCAGGPRRGS